MDIYERIIEPLEGYLMGYYTEKEVDWSGLRWCARWNRRNGDFCEVRETLSPYYHKLLIADKGFFRNGNTDSQAKKSLLDLLEGSKDWMVGVDLKDLDCLDHAVLVHRVVRHVSLHLKGYAFIRNDADRVVLQTG